MIIGHQIWICYLCDSLSGIQATTFSYVTEFHDSNTRKRAVAVVSIFLAATVQMTSLLGWIIIPLEINIPIFGLSFTSWRLYLLVASVIHLFTYICITLLPESPKFLLSMGKKKESINVMRRMYTVNTGLPMDVSISNQMVSRKLYLTESSKIGRAIPCM